MASSSIEAWHSWSHELPSCTDCVSSHSPSNALFTDDKFLRSMYQELRSRAFDRLIDATKGIEGGAAAVLQGGVSSDWELYDTDVDKAEFRQESFFRYLFGINEPDCYGVLDLKSHKSILFVPFASDDSERWNGERRSLSYYIDKYGVDECYWTTDLDEKLQEKGIRTVYLLYGENSDSGNMTKTTANWKGIEKYHQNKDLLIHVLTELRVIKTKQEIELMRAATRISSEAHVYVMRHIHPNMSELQCEALFQAYTRYFGSSRHMAYTCICGSGNHGAILHYGHAGRPNDKILVDGDYMVLDMGAEYVGYATDITRSYPINGKFTADQRAIHNAVYEAQKAVIDAMKPGVSWPSMHRLAERVIIEHLLKLGVVHNGTVDELMAAHIGTVFMPHGLGHLLGMAVHDVGGYEHGKKRSAEPGLCWLRCGRPLQAGMVITVEPGIYFNEKWITKALNDPIKSKYLNTEVIARFKNFGGCRLEDDVLVTENGADNLTILPTTPDQIELVMQNAKKK